MEYLELGNLGTYLEHNSALPELEAKEVVRQTLEGLNYMHESGYAHRDMKLQVDLKTEILALLLMLEIERPH
jgi:serine/threonine protein kinase